MKTDSRATAMLPGAKAEGENSQSDKPTQAISFLIVIAVARTIMTKWLLSGDNAFSYPVVYSSISCVATVLAILVLVVFGEVELRALQRKHLVPFIWVASLTAVDMGSTNIAVETISVALQQTIKAALPAVVVILELVLQGKNHGGLVYVSLIPLTVGPVLAAYGSSTVDFNLGGAIWMCVAVFAAALKSVKLYTAIQTIRKDMGMISFLLWLEVSTLVILVPWSFINGEMFEVKDYSEITSIAAWSIIIVISLLGGLRAFATTMVLRYSDPISLASANVLIQMSTIILSILLFNTNLTFLLLIGTVISLGGFALFTVAKFRHANPNPASDDARPAVIMSPDEATTQPPVEEASGSAAEQQTLLSEKKFGSHNDQLTEYGVEREWNGFGPASEIQYGFGETVKIRKPKIYNAIMRVLIIMHFLTGIAYLLWIAQNLTSSFGVIIGPMFLVAEFLSYIMRVICFTQYWTKQYKSVCPLKELTPTIPETEYPLVQFCVTHYREPVGETHPTLKGLLDMDYPPDKLEINILDDGYFQMTPDGQFVQHNSGKEMREMIRHTLESYARGLKGSIREWEWEAGQEARPEAALQGSLVIEWNHECFPTIRQICRRKGKVSHFKGGNLNNAIFNVLNDSRYQFFAFLDCDMAPTHDFLQLTVPLFLQHRDGQWDKDWVTGMCQAPQSFSNVNSNGSDDPLAQVQDFYWRRTMMHLDRWGIVHYYGTNVLFFRPAIEDALGWQYGVLSEDTPTGANVAEIGWKAVYMDQNIATGLCKDNVEETLIQRKRWAMGNMMWWMLTSPFFKCFTTTEFQNPPFYAEQCEHYAQLKKEARTAAPRAVLAEAGAPESIEATLGAARRNSVEDDPETSLARDPGHSLRQARMRDWVLTTMHNWSYTHVMLSNQVAAFWFVAYLSTALYMMLSAGESKYFPSDTIGLNVLFPAMHFITTTTLLYVIGPQSGMWRACQDRFAFAWVRLVAMWEGMHMAMTKNAKSGPWNAKVGDVLVYPPLFIFACVVGVFAYSLTLCLDDYDDCVSTVQSDSIFSANLPIQLVGLFLGLVTIVSMWPVIRSSLSNLCGFPMYKFRIFPAGSTWPYILALSPLCLVMALWVLWGSPDSVISEIESLTSSELCVDDRIAPSLFVVGCQQCATTSLYNDMTSHFPQLNSGTHMLTGESDDVVKAKHFFDDSYEEGMSWYLEHYPNCSSVETDDSSSSITVSSDFTPSYLQTSTTASRIHASYTHSQRKQLRFVSILRDPIDRLFSYYVSAKKDGSLDLTGYEDYFSADCLADPQNCKDVEDLTFDDWAQFQLVRAGNCETENPGQDLWPSCGEDGLFGSLYSLQLSSFLDYFTSSQISIVRFEAFSESGPSCLGNLASWLGMDFSRDGYSSSSDLDVTDTDDDETISDSIRDNLEKFFNPYTSQLYSLIADEGITFIDVIEKSDLF